MAELSYLSYGYHYITVDIINTGYEGLLVTIVHHSTEYIMDTPPPEIVDKLNIDNYDININMLNIFNVRYVLDK